MLASLRAGLSCLQVCRYHIGEFNLASRVLEPLHEFCTTDSEVGGRFGKMVVSWLGIASARQLPVSIQPRKAQKVHLCWLKVGFLCLTSLNEKKMRERKPSAPGGGVGGVTLRVTLNSCYSVTRYISVINPHQSRTVWAEYYQDAPKRPSEVKCSYG
jgi:hypothetical protein